MNGHQKFFYLENTINSLIWAQIHRGVAGASTPILFIILESWYVSEHAERHGFPSEWVGLTFSFAAIWNCIIAIVAVGEPSICDVRRDMVARLLKPDF